MENRIFASAICIATLSMLAPHARADAPSTVEARVTPAEASTVSKPSASTEAAALAAENGHLLPQAVSPQIYSGRAYIKATSGFDFAADSFRARASTEGTLTKFLAVRIDFAQGPSIGDDTQFGVGGKLQLLNQRSHGIDGGLALFYQPNDFRGEGNILGALTAGHRFGRFALIGNALFGGDAEGDDQTAEGRLAALYQLSQRIEIGLDNRFRFNASSDAKRQGTLTTDWELQAEPTLSVAFGPVALLANAGLSALQTTGPFGGPEEETNVDVGVVAMAGAAGAF